jgi:hypothetical protein
VRTTLHLVRPGAAAPAVAERDWVVYLQPLELAPSAHSAPLPAGPLSHDQLISLVFAADLVVTW